MKLIAISDLHGDYNSLRELKQYIIDREDIDLILMAGDICSEDKEITDIFLDLGIPIYYVLGNDDGMADKYSFGKDIDLKIIEFEGVNIIGCGGAPESKLNCPYEYDEKERYEELKKLFEKAIKPVIFVSHPPPKGVLDLASKFGVEHIGSTAVRKIIEEYEPLICICGHVHKDGGKDKVIEGKKTSILNVAPFGDDPDIDTVRGKRFVVIEIVNDTLKNWHFEYLVDPNIPLQEFIDRYI